jgi:hypothetical protein
VGVRSEAASEAMAAFPAGWTTKEGAKFCEAGCPIGNSNGNMKMPILTRDALNKPSIIGS